MNKKKRRPKLIQLQFKDLPQGARELAVVFHQYYARLYWANVVVRLTTDTQLIVQVNGRVNVARLARLQQMASGLVELQPIAPGYYTIMMWADAPKNVLVSGPDVEAPSDTLRVNYRPLT